MHNHNQNLEQVHKILKEHKRVKTLQLEQTKMGFKAVSERLHISQVLGWSLEKSEANWTESEFISNEDLATADLEIVSFARGFSLE